MWLVGRLKTITCPCPGRGWDSKQPPTQNFRHKMARVSKCWSLNPSFVSLGGCRNCKWWTFVIITWFWVDIESRKLILVVCKTFLWRFQNDQNAMQIFTVTFRPRTLMTTSSKIPIVKLRSRSKLVAGQVQVRWRSGGSEFDLGL